MAHRLVFFKVKSGSCEVEYITAYGVKAFCLTLTNIMRVKFH